MKLRNFPDRVHFTLAFLKGFRKSEKWGSKLWGRELYSTFKK